MSEALPFLMDQLPEEWALGEMPRFRRQQITEWVYERRAAEFHEMTSLPQVMREELSSKYRLRALELVRVQGSKDTTRKLLWRLGQGDFIESVLIPASPALYGSRSDRMTLCVSSQVGCAYGCRFCASGLEGWKRNLTAGEIVGQIIETERVTGDKINNLVFMGMGEPMANFENLRKAITMINSPWGVGIGARHITISTSGLVPRIRELADDSLQLGLAISLHGASDEVRSQIMPINRKHPVEELIGACEYFQEKKGRMITFEYILLKGINDHPEEAERLVKLARRVFAKVNLIPYNKVEGLPWERPSEEAIRRFAGIVKKAGIRSTVRIEKGHDIDAACGQLRLKQLKEEGERS